VSGLDPGVRRRPRIRLRRAVGCLLDGGFLEIPITADHVLAVGSLPPLHRDPFDRLLLAQAEREGLLLITADQTVARYPGPVRHSGCF
jgi:PIN domain nuclease of toxin-antitoxin system